MNSAETIIEALTKEFDGLSAQLQLDARFIIDHPREVGTQSMRSLAAKADVHPNTLVRLAQAIGFESYEPMRERFRDFLVTEGLGAFDDRVEWLQSLAKQGGTAAVVAEMAGATTQNLGQLWQGVDPAKLDNAAARIVSSPKTYVLGMGSAYSLAHQFWYVARMAFDHIQPIPRHGSQPIDDLSWLKKDETLIALTFQPYRSETMEAVRLAREVGAHIIGITDSTTSPLARFSNILLVAPTHTPNFFQSHAAVTALMETLIGALVAKAGAEAQEKIAQFHKNRLAAGLYDEPAPLAQLG